MNRQITFSFLIAVIIGTSLCAIAESTAPITPQNLFNDMLALRKDMYSKKNEFLAYVQNFQETFKTQKNYNWGDSFALVQAYINMYADKFKGQGDISKMGIIAHEGLTVSAYHHALHLRGLFPTGVIESSKAHVEGRPDCENSGNNQIRFFNANCFYKPINRMFVFSSCTAQGGYSFAASENVFGAPEYITTARQANLFFMIDDRVPSRGHLKNFMTSDQLYAGVAVVKAGSRKIIVVNYGRCTGPSSKLSPRASVKSKYTDAQMRSLMCFERGSSDNGEGRYACPSNYSVQ